MSNAHNDLLRIEVDSGKYTVVQDKTGATQILRYGEAWMGQDGSFAGVNAVLAMAYELEELRAQVAELQKAKEVAPA